MLARKQMSDEYKAWNRSWGAPFGRPVRGQRLSKTRRRAAGPFVQQWNSRTRAYEYPWAYYAVPVSPGSRLLEIGGALSGFQVALARGRQSQVHNVDPFYDYGASTAYPEAPERAHARLVDLFQADVVLHRCEIPEAALDAERFDVAYCISTIEHLPAAAISDVLRHVSYALKPGGHFVLTLDLFLDLAPFSSRSENRWGQNVSARALVEESGLELVAGERSELNGFDDFSPDQILSSLAEYLMGDYPHLAQTMVLRKPDASDLRP